MPSPQPDSPDSMDYSYLRDRSTSTTSRWSQVEVPYKLPSLSDMDRFNGSSSVSRWLQRLDWSFEAINGAGPSPATNLRTMNMLLDGEAAVFVDSSQFLCTVVEKLNTDKETITEKDVLEVTDALRQRFPNKVANSCASPGNESLVQDEWEVISEFFDRVKAAFQQAGGRDIPLKGEPDLTSFEQFQRSRFVSMFIQGLWSSDVRDEALTRLSPSLGLQEAMDWVKWRHRTVQCRYRAERLARMIARRQRMKSPMDTGRDF